MTRPITSSPAHAITLIAVLLAVLSTCAFAQGSGVAELTKVADAITAWDGNDPGTLLKAIKAANPDTPAIVSMRELNKALADKKMPKSVADKAMQINAKQKAAQRMVRQKVLAARDGSYARYRAENPQKSRSIYGNGDIGSWPTAQTPDASMDIDWTVFGVDPGATAELRDQCKSDLLRELAGDDSGLTLADFDVVITAEGHEAAAGVFETEGGIDWAKRNMKRVTIVQLDGSSRIYQLGTGDPIKEMAYAEHMAKFRELATKGGDYDKLFDEKGFLRFDLFDDPNSAEAQALWNKYMDVLSGFGVDFYRSRSSTATGGCLDMAKHLQEEVITKQHEPKAKLKKTLKYVSRADNISRGVPGLEKLLTTDPLLSDPAYGDVVDLAKSIGRMNDAQVDALLKERFGDMPDAGLQELGNKARRAILRMSEIAFQAEMDRIILEVPDKAQRKAALDKLTDDFRVISQEGGEYSDLARSAVDQISKVQDANNAGTIDQIRKNYQSLEKIRQAEQGVISQTVEFLKQTKLGSTMLQKGGKLLELGKQPVFDPVDPKYRSSSVEFVGEVVDSARAQNMKVVDYLGSVSMWGEVVDNVRSSKSDAELAIALSKTLINNTFFGMVLNTAYAGIVQGDNNALAKAVMYMLVPETALPALVEALGNTAINVTAQTLFDSQMDKVYLATTFDKDGKITDFSGLGMAGEEGARYFVDTMCDGAPEEVAQDIIAKSKATDFGKGSNAIAIKTVAKSIRSTVDNGTPLIFKEDGPLMRACAGIRKCTEDINDCAKIWGVEIALAANNSDDLPSGLDKGQTAAFLKLFGQREALRKEARKALADAMVRTFEERHRAEVSLDGGKAKEEYESLAKILEELGISKEGQASLDQEGCPYNMITRWTTSQHEQQITAVKAVQKFKDAYSFVLQARNSAEDAFQNNAGTSDPSPRPLTGSLPLTAKPEMDVQTAKSYLAEVSQIGQATVKDLELIKKSKLEGSYDTGMFRKLYEVRYEIAYWTAMMKAATEAQKLHWAVEVIDKQALYQKHSEASNKVGDLRKKESALQDEFKKHYELQGDFVVELSGPTQIPSGQEAKLVCTVKIKPQGGEARPVPEDISKQFRYAWLSGKVNLGEDQKADRSYKLDTIGDHTFKVIVKRTVMKAGKPTPEMVGQPALCTVRVTQDLGLTVKVDGKATAVIDEVVPLKAVVSAKKPPVPQLRYSWSVGKSSLGGEETASFKALAEGTHQVKLAVSALVGKSWQSAGEVTHTVRVSKSQAVSVSIEGSDKVKPDEKVKLTASVTGNKDLLAGIRCVWKEGQTALGEGMAISYTSREEKAHTITVIVLGAPNGKEEELARAEHQLTVAKEDIQLSGVTADLEGVKSEVVTGGSVEVGATNFRDSKGLLGTDKHKFKVVWQSAPKGEFTPKETINSGKSSIIAGKEGSEVEVWADILLEKDGKFVPVGTTERATFTVTKSRLSVRCEATKVTLKPGESADILAVVTGSSEKPLKYVWTGDHAGASADMSKVAFSSRTHGEHVLSVEVTDAKGNKGTASVTLAVLGVTASLAGVPGDIFYGQSAPISVNIEGLDKLKPADKPKSDSKQKNEDWVLTEIEKDDDPGEGPNGYEVYNTSEHSDTSFTGMHHHPTYPVTVRASWGAFPQRVKPGQKIAIPWSISCQSEPHDGEGSINFAGDGQSPYDMEKEGIQGFGSAPAVEKSPSQGTYAYTFPQGIPGKKVKISVNANAYYSADGSVKIASNWRGFVYTFAGEEPVKVEQGVKTIWQSDPAITFSPSTSMDQKTTARFDRMGKVKVWAEVQIEQDGLWQTVGETEQSEVEVKPPKFVLAFDPAEGQGKVGQEIKATVTPEPAVDKSLIQYAWSNPASSNRMPYEDNESVIGFKLKDANPIELQATAKVPTVMDVIGEVTGSYTASPYTVKAEVLGASGPKPQIWKEGVGLVTVDKNVFCSDEQVRVKATIEGEPMPAEVRWKWTANEGTTLGNDIAQEITVSRHETGSADLTVEARDKDGTFLGKATASFSVTVSSADLRNAKDKGGAGPEVTLIADKTSLKIGEKARLTASAKGGKAPYSYSWQGDVSGAGTSATLTAEQAGEQTVTVTVRDASGKTATKSVKIDVQGAFDVTLNADKIQLKVYESTSIKAVPDGGKAPYKYKWFGTGIVGEGASIRFTGQEPGSFDLTLVISDAAQKSVKKAITITVTGLVLGLTGVPDEVAIGTEAVTSVTYQQPAAGSGADKPIVHWHTEPAVTMRVSQSESPSNVITFDKAGPVKVWGEVMTRSGKSLGKTEVKTANVVSPTFVLELSKASDSQVLADIKITPQLDTSLFEFRWLLPKGGSSDSSHPNRYTFTPAKGAVTDVVVAVRSKQSGALLQNLKEVYDPASGKQIAKDDASAADSKPEKVSEPVKPTEPDKTTVGSDKPKQEPAIDRDTAKNLEKAESLAAKGNIDEAVAIVDSVAKANPDAASATAKKVAAHAVKFGSQEAADLEFANGLGILDAAVRLDPGNAEARQVRDEIKAREQTFSRAQSNREEAERLLGERKLVSAESLVAETKDLVRGFPSGNRLKDWQKSLDQMLTKPREEYRKWLDPLRKDIRKSIDAEAYGDALPVIRQGLERELYPADEKELNDWQALCEQKIAGKQDDLKKANGYFTEANAHLEKSRFREAVAAYDKGIALHPEVSEAFRKRGVAKAALDDIKGAIADYDKAIDLDAKNVSAYLHRGFAREKQGDRDRAIRDYEKVLDLDPGNATARKRLDELTKKPEPPVKKPDSDKKDGGLLGDLSDALDKIDQALGGKKKDDTLPSTQGSAGKPDSQPTKVDKPTMVHDNGNTGSCGFTDTAKFTLNSAVNVTQLAVWYNWDAGEKAVAYKLYDSGGKLVRSGNFTRGGCDTYQSNWCNGVDEPNINLSAGSYTCKIAKARVCQNSGTGGNGTIRVVTGGAIFPSPGPSKTTTSSPSGTKPTTTQPSNEPLKPVSPGNAPPKGWVQKTVGDVTVYLPGDWKAVSGAPKDQGAWYLGDEDDPTVGFGVVREETIEGWLSDIESPSKSDVTVSGLPAVSYIGKVRGEPLVGWVIGMKNPRPDGRPLCFLGVARQSTWQQYRPTLEKIIGSIKLAGAPTKTTASAPKQSSIKTVKAILQNSSKQNVHIFVEGGTFSPSNRLTPGEKRTITVNMPADGRIKFVSGRNGTVVSVGVWNGDPDDDRRFPKVTFSVEEKLIITTGLQ